MAATLNEGPADVPRGPAGEPAAEPADDGADCAAIRLSLRQPEQFAVLYDRYAAVLHRYAGRRVGDEFADDLVAATSWRHSGRASATTWQPQMPGRGCSAS
jgi:hypothetical protein